ncbi:iron chelate uptake ABC transporter family permease subunit [Vitreoscilla massiliensis]|uniref:Iron chelate uptake ABC transporter family permease subunit n=1 Tax=Vitreoscilla massiliensis TaxID=1689272 RepID=A0ABY4E0Z2_9NEIS|nr:iron chelate uptake ABC transporter family permease subunit [Vitreoscilla massiliensis]UOO88993.1 iron chelate uptake ABC transporter family permease subunit [Vitreoscilla massiliensis]
MAESKRLWLMLAVTLALVGVYFVWDNSQFTPFVNLLRLKTLGAIFVTAMALGSATLLFHAISNNRIVTPSSLGLEFLYVLAKTSFVFFFGSAALMHMNVVWQFVFGCAILIGFALLLYRMFFQSGRENVFYLLLIGMICMSLFMTTNTFLGMLMNPNEFQIAQDAGFATFNQVDATVLTLAACIVIPLTLYSFSLSRQLDVLGLGRETAINLGIDYERFGKRVMVIVAVLMATATSLAGPMFFFGLLILNVTLQWLPTFRHRLLFPAIILVSTMVLVLGQTVVLHLLNFKTELDVIINFVGGLYFFWLLLKANKQWQ